MLKLKRAYDAPAKNDGLRILVDRLWPRGISKEELKLDEWDKDVAPSTALRKWFGHDPERWAEFKKRYHAELEAKPEGVQKLKRLAARKIVTLVYGAKDDVHNHAIALKEFVLR